MKLAFLAGTALAGVTATLHALAKRMELPVRGCEIPSSVVAIRGKLPTPIVYDPAEPAAVPGAAEELAFLRKTDILVFVADGQPERLQANIESLARWLDVFARVGRDHLPVILAVTKQDLPGSMPSDELRAHLDHPFTAVIPLCAPRGEGIPELLVALTSSR